MANEKLTDLIRKADKGDHISETQDQHYEFMADRLTENGVIIPVRCGECLSHDDESCPTGRVWCKTMCRYMEKDGYCSEGKDEANA